MPNMTGRLGYRTMEMNGGNSSPYLACTPCVPLFVHCLIRVEAEGLLDYQGRAGIISIVRWNLRPVIFGVEPCFREYPDLFRVARFSSDMFRYVVRTNQNKSEQIKTIQNKSEQIRETPFCRPLLQIPEVETWVLPSQQEKIHTRILYASWGPILWPSLRSSARAPTIKAVRRTVAIKGVFNN